MKPEAMEQLGVLLMGELGKLYERVGELPEELNGKLAAVEKATKELKQATESAITHAGALKSTADAVVASSVETTKAQLVQAVSQTAEKVTYNTSRKSMLQWVAGCLGAATFCLAVFGYLMFAMGQEAGYQSGRGDTIHSQEYQKSVFAWSTSPEGKMALALAEIGVLRGLYACEGPGWVVEERNGGRFCVPKAEKGKQPWGWQLPSQPLQTTPQTQPK